MLRFKIILGVLFGLLITAIAFFGIVSYQYNERAVETSESIDHSHRILDKAEEISSLYKEIQLQSNAFYINQDSSLIDSYQNMRNKAQHDLTDLGMLVADNLYQQRRADALNFLVNRLITFTYSIFLPTGQPVFTRKALQYRFKENTMFRARINLIIDSIEIDHHHFLTILEKANLHNVSVFQRTFFLLLSTIGLLLAVTFFSIRYNFNKRIRVQQALRNANELFEKLFYESPIAIVMSEQHTGRIINCNKVYADFINYERKDIIGKTAAALGVLDRPGEGNKIVSGANENGNPDKVEVYLKPKNKEAAWVSISMQAIRIQDRDCLLSAIIDLTTHKLAEEKKQDALHSEMELNKMKTNFVTLASHEFRTPLTTILSSAFLLGNYSFGENQEKISKHLGRIRSSVNNLTSILDEFLSLTKIEEGRIQPHLEVINLKQIFERGCQDLQSFTKPGQSIVYHHNGSQEITSDPVLLGNILNNLVTNAIKYSPANTTIYVSSQVNGKICLSVKDCGIGISEADQKHLFNRFYRASNAGNVQGTGLGLHILKHYVDMLKGSIKVKSELGKGTEFEIIFRTADLAH